METELDQTTYVELLDAAFDAQDVILRQLQEKLDAARAEIKVLRGDSAPSCYRCNLREVVAALAENAETK
jgi:hypothetical protein